MTEKLNPVCRRGDRNVFCVYYGDCLDHAVDHRWRYWNCTECSHKLIQQVPSAVQTVNDSNIYYEFSPTLSREVLQRFD